MSNADWIKVGVYCGFLVLLCIYLLLTLLHKHGELVDVEDVVLQEHPLYQDVDS